MGCRNQSRRGKKRQRPLPSSSHSWHGRASVPLFVLKGWAEGTRRKVGWEFFSSCFGFFSWECLFTEKAGRWDAPVGQRVMSRASKVTGNKKVAPDDVPWCYYFRFKYKCVGLVPLLKSPWNWVLLLMFKHYPLKKQGDMFENSTHGGSPGEA